MISKRSFFTVMILAFAGFGFGQNQYVEIQPEAGEGVYSLLRKYQINTPCNRNQFYSLNPTVKKKGLKKHKTYRLPILVYNYNGKSIRSTTGINDRPWAEKIQAYNEQMDQASFKEGDYRKDKVLWVPYAQIHCRTQEDWNLLASEGQGGGVPGQPRAGQQVRGVYPIFGAKYATVPLDGNDLRGKVYYLVGGHGGPDPGAVGSYRGKSLCEDEYAYDITLRLARNLLSYGATVYLITRDEDDGIRETEILPCDKDENCWVGQEIPINQKERLTQRSDAVNSLYKKNKKQGVKFQRLVVLHVDSDSKKERIDVYFYHKIRDKKSERLAENLRHTMKIKYDQYRKGRGYDGTVSSRDLHMLRETIPTAVFIELGNIRNRNDQARLVIEGNRQLISNWLFEGLMRDAKNNP
ncbi:MAG: N-acetylmuramoyl-L-alanine amidase [Bacteroidota bacterium]